MAAFACPAAAQAGPPPWLKVEDGVTQPRPTLAPDRSELRRPVVGGRSALGF